MTYALIGIFFLGPHLETTTFERGLSLTKCEYYLERAQTVTEDISLVCVKE